MPEARLQRTREAYDYGWWRSDEEREWLRMMIRSATVIIGEHLDVVGPARIDRAYGDTFFDPLDIVH